MTSFFLHFFASDSPGLQFLHCWEVLLELHAYCTRDCALHMHIEQPFLISANAYVLIHDMHREEIVRICYKEFLTAFLENDKMRVTFQ